MVRDSKHTHLRSSTGVASVLSKLVGSVRRRRSTKEWVTTLDSLGRLTSRPVRARRALPPSDRSLMDGFAVRLGAKKAHRTGSAAGVRIVGRSIPGTDPRRLPPLRSDTAVEVLTGSPMPPGADAVLRIESSRRKGNRVWATDPILVGKDVARKGEDFRRGEPIVGAGVRIRPWHLAALLANDVPKLEVYARPCVGLLTTGSEVVGAGRTAPRTQVRDTTKPLLGGMLAELNVPSLDLGHVPDRKGLIRRAVQRGLDQCDVLITVGGSSVGRRDLVPRAVEEAGGTKWIAREVGLRPGGTAAVATVHGRPVFVLPGPPVAAFTAFLAIVEPFLRLHGDLPNPGPTAIAATLDQEIDHPRGIRELVRVRIKSIRGRNRVSVVARHGATRLSTLTQANGLLFLEERRGKYPAGEVVRVIPFEAREGGNPSLPPTPRRGEPKGRGRGLGDTRRTTARTRRTG
jgi:molybdopterin molybdotransferase